MFKQRGPSAAQKTSVAYTDRILSRAGVRARRERSPIFCAGGTSLETCSSDLRKLVGDSFFLNLRLII